MLDSKEAILNVLNECVKACNHCYSSCLSEGNAAQMADCIISDRECADVCTLTAQFVVTDSRNVDKMLQLCRDICLHCEEICRKHPAEHCQKCAEACHHCHLACDEYLRLTV
ncbi:four-helix bundle copper-binding protein [soil metagenome]